MPRSRPRPAGRRLRAGPLFSLARCEVARSVVSGHSHPHRTETWWIEFRYWGLHQCAGERTSDRTTWRKHVLEIGRGWPARQFGDRASAGVSATDARGRLERYLWAPPGGPDRSWRLEPAVAEQAALANQLDRSWAVYSSHVRTARRAHKSGPSPFDRACLDSTHRRVTFAQGQHARSVTDRRQAWATPPEPLPLLDKVP